MEEGAGKVAPGLQLNPVDGSTLPHSGSRGHLEGSGETLLTVSMA